jgi:hypothetical protein
MNQGYRENDSKCDVVFWILVRIHRKPLWKPPSPLGSLVNGQETLVTLKKEISLVTCETYLDVFGRVQTCSSEMFPAVSIPCCSATRTLEGCLGVLRAAGNHQNDRW